MLAVGAACVTTQACQLRRTFNGFRHLTKSAISAKWSQMSKKCVDPSVFLPLPFRELLLFFFKKNLFELLTPWFAPETTLRNLTKRIQPSTATTPCDNSFRFSSVSRAPPSVATDKNNVNAQHCARWQEQYATMALCIRTMPSAMAEDPLVPLAVENVRRAIAIFKINIARGMELWEVQ